MLPVSKTKDILFNNCTEIPSRYFKRVSKGAGPVTSKWRRLAKQKKKCKKTPKSAIKCIMMKTCYEVSAPYFFTICLSFLYMLRYKL